MKQLRLERFFDSAAGAVYEGYIERERVARAVGRFLWGADMGCFFASIEGIGVVQDGAVVLDVPCGGGVAFRGVSPSRTARYFAVDASPQMLARAQRRVGASSPVEFIVADVAALPVADGVADLVLSYNGLHCFPDPGSAVCEMSRCMKPGGMLVGTTFVRQRHARADFFLKTLGRLRILGPSGTLEDVLAWFEAAALDVRDLETSGSLLVFRASRRSR